MCLVEVTLVQKCSKNCVVHYSHVLRIPQCRHFPRLVSSKVLIGAVDPICYFVSLVHRYIGGHISGSPPQVIFEIRGQPRMGGERAGLRLPGARTKVRGRGRRSARDRAAVLWPVPRLRKGRALLPRRRQKPPNKRIRPQKRSMFQKGTKRKFADAGGEEEEEEEAALRTGVAVGMGVGVGVGIGVGALAGEDPVSLRLLSSYSLQRQTLLNMSLVKLQLCHMLVEPNLCRSVLIANTVRHIQEEMTYDLTWQVRHRQSGSRCPEPRPRSGGVSGRLRPPLPLRPHGGGARAAAGHALQRHRLRGLRRGRRGRGGGGGGRGRGRAADVGGVVRPLPARQAGRELGHGGGRGPGSPLAGRAHVPPGGDGGRRRVRQRQRRRRRRRGGGGGGRGRRR
ncbi:uncharacterized protein LOC134067159 isoform X5 [Sardina pilchardus]|uniref:uncharacterized protein LOC134067159 isoform X5 n=1 Tax=Sardina pilchardus TaxID=27697 RepID=UPI002E15BEB0